MSKTARSVRQKWFGQDECWTYSIKSNEFLQESLTLHVSLISLSLLLMRNSATISLGGFTSEASLCCLCNSFILSWSWIIWGGKHQKYSNLQRHSSLTTINLNSHKLNFGELRARNSYPKLQVSHYFDWSFLNYAFSYGAILVFKVIWIWLESLLLKVHVQIFFIPYGVF